MRKIIYLIVALTTLAFTACTPLEDVYDELDATGQETPIVGDVIYTLTDEDYTSELNLDNEYFETLEEAKSMIAGFLTDKYPVWGKGSSALITFNLSELVGKTEYTVTNEDYTAIGLTNLVSYSDFNKFFEYKFPNVDKGSIVDLTYKTLAPKIDYTLTDDDFDLVGNGRFNNFDIRPGKDEETIESRRAKIQIILKNNFPGTSTGQQYLVEYAIYDGSPGVRSMLVQLNASGSYDLINGYTLTDADYDLVGNGRYDNFDIRPGKDDETEEARRVKIETILLNNFPSANSGDQYFVTYDIYDGTSGTRNMLLEFNGTSYDLIGATLVSKTTRFAFVNDWSSPFILELSDYQAMGQSFDNFNGRNADQKAEANRLIEVYLGMLYPFAAEGDFVAVQYNSYEGSGVTAVENVNFTFDGSKWNGIVDMTIQFGHNGTEWEPDNTIKYSFVADDYSTVYEALKDVVGYEAAAGNLNQYGNFGRPTSNDDLEAVDPSGNSRWNNLMMFRALPIALNKIDPAALDGQKYVVTVSIYNGSAGTESFSLIKEDGDWIENK